MVAAVVRRARAAAVEAWLVLAVGAVLAGAALRLWQLGEGSLSHPEIYIPGIPLLPGLSEPPPRHAYGETLAWHFAEEPHPPGYYMAMWAWTKLAGTTPFALRLPAALVGIGLIALAYGLAARVFDRRAGAIAALLVALNGFAIYWSQMARMYVPGAALAVGATWALVVLARSERPRPGLATGYVAMLVAGTQTLELFWAVPMLHAAWAAWVLGPRRLPDWREVALPWRAPGLRIVQLQAIAMALAAPEFIHAALHARTGAAPEPVPRFLLDYAGFGFLFEHHPGNSPGQPLPLAAAVVLAGLALAFVAAAARAPAAGPAARPAGTALPFALIALASALGAALALFLASIAERHQQILAGFALLPVMCLWLPGLALLARPLAERLVPQLARAIDRLAPETLLLMLLALVPPLVFYAASAEMSVLAPRAFLPFATFLLILVAAGVPMLARSQAARALAVALLALLLAASVAYFRERPQSPRDYQQLGAILAREQRPGDVVMVRERHWADTPLFYYLPRARYLAGREPAELAALRPPRVWVPHWLTDGAVNRDYRDEMLAEAGYVEAGNWPVMGGRATLFLPSQAGDRR